MDLDTALDGIRREIDRCYFALCFEMESGLPLGISTAEFKDDKETIAAAFGQVLGIVTHGQQHGRNEMIREAMLEFKELILETKRSTFFIRVPEKNNRIAVAVGVPNDVKVGFARVSIDKHTPTLMASIRRVL
ncbi:MAG: hypothetical protein ACFCGT_22490 [Sandaracinaceae bacterium]